MHPMFCTMHFSTLLYSWQAAFVWETVLSQLSFAVWSETESPRTGGSKKCVAFQCRNTQYVQDMNKYLTLPLDFCSSLSVPHIPLSSDAVFGLPFQEML